MKQLGKLTLFGFLLWLTVFVLTMAFFVWHDSDRALFETLVSITLTASTVLYAIMLFRRIHTDFFNYGIKMGVIWVLVALIIDVPMFTIGMEQSLLSYFKDIGMMYVSIPLITVTIGYLLKLKSST